MGSRHCRAPSHSRRTHPGNRGREGPGLAQGRAASRGRGARGAARAGLEAPRAGAAGAGSGVAARSGPAAGPRLPCGPRPAGVRPPPVRPLLREAAAARGNLCPALGARRGGRGAAGARRAEPRGMPSGGAAWGGAARPCNSSRCPGLKIPPALPSPALPSPAPAVPFRLGRSGPSPGTAVPFSNLSSRGLGGGGRGGETPGER